MSAVLPSRRADAPTHVAVECRLTTPEAEAVEQNLVMLASMIRRQVCPARGGDVDATLSGIAKLIECIGLRLEPFDDFGG